MGLPSSVNMSPLPLTRTSGDQGIDFYGRLKLERHIFPNDPFPTIQRHLSTWLIGQAKRYIKTQVSTPEIRDLVGAVELAKGNAFSVNDFSFPHMKIRVCDPVFYLFFTTGRMSQDTWKLLNSSGVIGMDGEQIAAFLADRRVGANSGRFIQSDFEDWLRQYS